MRISLPALASALCITCLPLQAISAVDFNPAISLSLMGHAYYDNRRNEGQEWLDQGALFPLQGEGEHSSNSFNLDGSELSFSSNVDGYFKAFMAISYEDEGIELEEAWMQSSQLPFGFQVRAGRFLSGIGYHNTKHQHDWDFIDQNLTYQSLFHGEHLHGDGLQLTWLLPTDSYWLIGAEVMQGDDFNGFGQSLEDLPSSLSNADLQERRGPNFFSGFVRFAPDLGSRQALQLGASTAWHRQQQNFFETDTSDIAADGKAQLVGMQAIYKWFARDAYGTGGIDLTAEYFYASSRLHAREVTAPLSSEHIRQDLHTAYVQGLYGFAPRWQAGLRYSATGFADSYSKIDKQKESAQTATQTSALLVWGLTEFSRLRFEASYLDNLDIGNDQRRSAAQFMLGYVVFLGAHPAHTF